MIEVSWKDPTGMEEWLSAHVGPHLRPDVSSYARGRMRAWIGDEPPLSERGPSRPGVAADDAAWKGLQDRVGWRFDYCLVTFSGESAAGILPHRDAPYADYEAAGWNVGRTCTFLYWQGRQTLGKSPDVRGLLPSDPPTHEITMVLGTFVRFNCKNLHAAVPSVNRWSMNFWRVRR